MIQSLLNPRRRLFNYVTARVAVALAMLMPLIARAAAEDVSEIDARLEGYNPSVILKDASGTGMTIFLLVVLLGLTMGVMFINAHRSHLD